MALMPFQHKRSSRRVQRAKQQNSGFGGGSAANGTGANGADGSTQELRPSVQEVVAAVESLYSEEVKPFGRILRKRIGERAFAASTADQHPAAAAAASLPCVGLDHLRALCESCPLLRLEPEEGGAWSALLVNREPTFIDVYSPHDPYPDELWEAAAAYFGSSKAQDVCLPGGRYACAEALIELKLPFLAGLSLGQVCHVVQLAIAQRKVFGYLHGNVVPYGRSQSMVKDNCAVWQQPCGSLAAATMPVASWEDARHCLWEILDSATGQSPGRVPMSNVKRLFRSRFQVELSETALGYTRLYELLQDPRFEEICSVRLQGNGYIVVRNTDGGGWRPKISLDGEKGHKQSSEPPGSIDGGHSVHSVVTVPSTRHPSNDTDKSNNSGSGHGSGSGSGSGLQGGGASSTPWTADTDGSEENLSGDDASEGAAGDDSCNRNASPLKMMNAPPGSIFSTLPPSFGKNGMKEEPGATSNDGGGRAAADLRSRLQANGMSYLQKLPRGRTTAGGASPTKPKLAQEDIQPPAAAPPTVHHRALPVPAQHTILSTSPPSAPQQPQKQQQQQPQQQQADVVAWTSWQQQQQPQQHNLSGAATGVMQGYDVPTGPHNAWDMSSYSTVTTLPTPAPMQNYGGGGCAPQIAGTVDQSSYFSTSYIDTPAVAWRPQQPTSGVSAPAYEQHRTNVLPPVPRMPDCIESDLCFAEGPSESDLCFAQGPSSLTDKATGSSTGDVQWLPEISFQLYQDVDEMDEEVSPSRRKAFLAGGAENSNCVVKNTFIDIAMPESPRTDVGARRRSKSLPKDMGSPKRLPRKATHDIDDIDDESIFDESLSPVRSPVKAPTHSLRVAPPAFSLSDTHDASFQTKEEDSDSESCKLGSGDEMVLGSTMSRRREKRSRGAIGPRSTTRRPADGTQAAWHESWAPAHELTGDHDDWSHSQWDGPWL